MKIGILKEEKLPFDKRVPLTPLQCKYVHENFSNIKIVVRSCNERCFSNENYIDNGIEVVECLDDCDVLLGIKEILKVNIIPKKTYLFFSHTIKKQEYNKALLKEMLIKKVKLIDYEVLKYSNGKRILGFGRYAGIVGAYNAFRTYGLKKQSFKLKPANKCYDRLEMEDELDNIILNNEKIIVTGKGRVGSGIIELLNIIGVKEVSIKQFLNRNYSYPIFLNLDVMDYYERKDLKNKSFHNFVDNPNDYESCFLKFSSADIFIAGHYYEHGSPFLFTRSDVRSETFNFSVVADISCDIDGPVATTIRSSTVNDPVYGYNPVTEKEDNFMNDKVIAVMAVDNLPCELPKDSSSDFGDKIISELIPLLIKDQQEIIRKATICENGDLTTYYEYLRDFVESD